MGAAVVGGATYLFNQSTTASEQTDTSSTYLEQVSQAYTQAATDYLTRFSTQAFSILHDYEEIAEKIINIQVTEAPLKMTTQRHHLQLLQVLLDNLNQELEIVSANLSTK